MRVSKRWISSLTAVGLGGLMAATTLSTTTASSHREAPLITEDPVADATDTYAFVSPDAPDTVTLVGNFIPLEPPAAGPNFHRFGDDVLYEFDIDVDGDSYGDVSYEFRFKTTIKNGDTFLYNTGQVTSLGDDTLNVVQTYSITKVDGKKREVIARDLIVAPANVGPRSMPDYDSLAAEATYDIGEFKAFAGPRDDPFFADLGSIFDLLGLRPLNEAHLINLPFGDGIDYLAPYNVHTIALQVPISEFKEYASDPDPVIGVYTASHRRKTRVLDNDGDQIRHNGKWVQVSRLGGPLVNEVVIPLKKKDAFNGSQPSDDAQFAEFVLDPEPARLIPVLYPGVTVPPTPRNDLVAIFLTGIPELNQQKVVVGSERLRLNTAIKPGTTDPNAQNRLGLLGGETDGFPNGRRLVDDVVDIELRALAGGTPFTAEFNVFPNNALTDGVDANDTPFLTSFPYVAGPTAGYERP